MTSTNPVADPFLLDDVVPALERSLSVDTQKRGLCLAGASYGAAAVLYAATQHPERVDGLLLESPALHIGDGALLRIALETRRWPSRLYVGVGTAEGDDEGARDEMVRNARTLFRHVAATSSGDGLTLLVQEGGVHWFTAWRTRLERALLAVLAR